jgi:hypothetical protein
MIGKATRDQNFSSRQASLNSRKRSMAQVLAMSRSSIKLLSGSRKVWRRALQSCHSGKPSTDNHNALLSRRQFRND